MLIPSDTQPRAAICPVTGVTIQQPRPLQRFVSATILRNDDDLLLTLNSQFRQYAKGSKEDEYTRTAHNIRNVDSNQRNNLRRKINRLLNQHNGQQGLFPDIPRLYLTDKQQALLDYWKGTDYEVQI